MYKILEKQAPSSTKEDRPAKNNGQGRQQGSPNGGQTAPKQGKEVEVHNIVESKAITPLSVSTTGHSLHMRQQAVSPQQPAPKRLKLKDYMHLASIQRKSKSKITPKSEPHPDTCPSLTSILDEPHPAPRQPDPTDIIKTDLLLKLQGEIRKLEDLCEYISTELKRKDNESETHHLLFDLHGDAGKNAEVYERMGQRMASYDPSNHNPNRRTGCKYYWRQDRLSVQSPAKMLRMGLDMTFRLTKILSKSPTHS